MRRRLVACLSCAVLIMAGCGIGGRSQVPPTPPPELPPIPPTACKDVEGPLSLAGIKLGDSVSLVEERLGRSDRVLVDADASNRIRILDIEEGADIGEILPGISLGMNKEAIWNQLVAIGVCPAGPDSQDFGVFRDGHHLILMFRGDVLIRARLALNGL